MIGCQANGLKVSRLTREMSPQYRAEPAIGNIITLNLTEGIVGGIRVIPLRVVIRYIETFGFRSASLLAVEQTTFPVPIPSHRLSHPVGLLSSDSLSQKGANFPFELSLESSHLSSLTWDSAHTPMEGLQASSSILHGDKVQRPLIGLETFKAVQTGP